MTGKAATGLTHIPGVMTLDADDRRVEKKLRKRGLWTFLHGCDTNGAHALIFDEPSGGGRVSRHVFVRFVGFEDSIDNGLAHVVVLDSRARPDLADGFVELLGIVRLMVLTPYPGAGLKARYRANRRARV